MKRLYTATILVAGLLTGAQATTLSIESMVPGLSQSVKIKYNGHTQTVLAGAQSVSIDGADPIALYCIDLDHGNRFGDTYGVNIQDVSTVANSAMVSNLMTNFWSTIDTSTEAAAFQLALWDVVVDGGDGLNSGNFKGVNIKSSIASQFSQYQAAIYAGGPEALTLSVYNATSHGHHGNIHQNLIGAESVPEPATLLIAPAIFALLKKRRK
jgi:hypothetical protein